MLQCLYLHYLHLYFCTCTSPRAAAFSLLHSLHTCLANAKFATERKQETEKDQCQLICTLKEQEMGGGSIRSAVSREKILEKTVVRDRADRMGRKGATKRPASSPPHLDKMAGGEK